jgi:hypothetical protein
MLRRVVESAAELNTYAQIALVLFLVAFVLVLIREKKRGKQEVEHLQNLPLQDGSEQGDAVAAAKE